MEIIDDHRINWDDIMIFARTNTSVIFSTRGVCGVNKYIEKKLRSHGIDSASDLLEVFTHYFSLYGEKCNDKLGEYLSDIGVKNPRRMIIISALEARNREMSIEMMNLKPHRVITEYF